MNRATARAFRVTSGVLLAVATAMLAACGASTSPTPAAVPTARFDQRLHDLLPASVRASGVLRVGTEASYAPMSSFGPDGRTIIGMEPDLGVQMGRVLGVHLQFANTPFSKLLPQVASGGLDLAISAMTDTPQRAKSVDFVDYFRAGTSIVVQRGNPSHVTKLGDLCGNVVAVENGTVQVDLLARTQSSCLNKPIVVRTYPTNSDALVQLRTGRVVAVPEDFPPAVFLVTDVRNGSHYQLASPAQYEPGLYGIAVAKDHSGLRDAVAGALAQLLRSGVYSTTLTRLHVQGGGVQQITINSGR